MKRILHFFSVAAAALTLVSCSGQFNMARALQGGMLAAQALTLSDEEIQAYVHEYVQQMDAQSTILPENNAYTKRLRRMTSPLKEVDGIPLNFQVYKTDDVNAFACADGSVRVYTGLMNIMTDDELLGVIGHEIGHVAMRHTKQSMQQAMLTSAAMEGIASIGDKAAALTDSQLGAIGNAILNARYSRKQESAADDFGYDFLKAAGRNPWAMCMSLEKLQQVAGETEAGTSSATAMSNIFSSHPDTQTRIENMSARATADGFQRPKQ